MLAQFAQGLITPLRKNGDSDSAVVYRPIMLLNRATRFLQNFWRTESKMGCTRSSGTHNRGSYGRDNWNAP